MAVHKALNDFLAIEAFQSSNRQAIRVQYEFVVRVFNFLSILVFDNSNELIDFSDRILRVLEHIEEKLSRR